MDAEDGGKVARCDEDDDEDGSRGGRDGRSKQDTTCSDSVSSRFSGQEIVICTRHIGSTSTFDLIWSST